MSKNSRRIMEELKKLTEKDPIPGVTATVGDNSSKWNVKIQGPQGTPYEGAILNLIITLPPDYPHKAPKFVFNPRVPHPNINKDDGIPCLKDLNEYSPTKKIRDILLQLINLIKQPELDHADNTDLAMLYKDDRSKYDEEIKKWAQQHTE